MALPLGLHLEEGDERVHLLRDPVARISTLRQPLTQNAQAARHVLQGIPRHRPHCALSRGASLKPTSGPADSLTWLTKWLPPKSSTPPPSRTGSARCSSS